MQSYPTRERASEDRQGIASEWHPNRQHQQQPQRRAPPQNTSSSNQTSVPQGRLSPDVRRNYYTSPRQQQREYQQQQAGNSAVTSSHSLRARLPQHQIQIPPSEPIYLDIDPSIHQPMTVDHAGHPTPFTPTTNAAMMSPDIKSSHYVGQPPTHPANYRSSHPDGGIATTPQQQQQSRTHNSPNYPYVNPYVSPVAKEYRVQGGMFQNNYSPQPSYNNNRSANAASPTTSRDDNAILYDTTPIAANANSNNPAAQEYMIMFGDDYDLGSINTGMSQQELLQKRRDVKKRRDGKYGKKKKSKDRIIDIPPRLLASARSWDTSPITKLVGASNTKNANGNDKVDQHHPAKDIGSKSPVSVSHYVYCSELEK